MSAALEEVVSPAGVRTATMHEFGPDHRELKELVSKFLEYTRPSFDEKEFPERPHGGACGPDAGCDGACAEIYHLNEYNRLRKQLEEYVK